MNSAWPFLACGPAQPARSRCQYGPRPAQAGIIARTRVGRSPRRGHTRGGALADGTSVAGTLVCLHGEHGGGMWQVPDKRMEEGAHLSGLMTVRWTTSGSWRDPGSSPVAQWRIGTCHS
jgi:hypothetical protein